MVRRTPHILKARTGHVKQLEETRLGQPGKQPAWHGHWERVSTPIHTALLALPSAPWAPSLTCGLLAQGPEPIPEEFPHEPLEDLPTFVPPMLLESPQYVEPPQFVPQWAAPCEPRPVGFLRGTAPLLICDVSGTMNSRQQGRFREMKRCAVDLLDPEGKGAGVVGAL